MNPADYPTAWDHPPTRRAWVGHMAMNGLGLIGWIGGWIVLLGISTRTPNWVVWVFMPYFFYGAYRAFIQVRYFPLAFHMLRVLRAYPWQLLLGVPRGLDEHPDAEDKGIWIELPSPGDRTKKIPLTFVKHHRAYWWLKRIGGPRTKPALKAQLEPLWFAGDPRFLGVVAARAKGGSAPRRLHFLYQPSAFNKAAPRRQWEDASPADLERARHAGALLLDAVLRSR